MLKKLLVILPNCIFWMRYTKQLGHFSIDPDVPVVPVGKKNIEGHILQKNLKGFPFTVPDFDTGFGLTVSNVFQTIHGPLEIVGHQIEFSGKLPDFIVLYGRHPFSEITVHDDALHIGNDGFQGAQGTFDVEKYE